MIRKLLATTAVATLIATGAMAQATAPAPATAPEAAPAQPMVKKAEGELASNFIGTSVYNGSGDDAENIGEISDIVLGADGQVQAVVVGVGGFLGLGQKKVALEYDLAKWIERDNNRYLVIETTADALKALPDFDTAAYEPQPADADVAETPPATQEDLKNAESQAATEQTAEGADDQAAAPADTAPATDTTATAPATDTGAATEDQAAAEDAGDGDQAMTSEPEEPNEAQSQNAGDPASTPTDDAASDTAAAPADGAATDQAAEAPADDAATDQAAEAPADGAATDQAAEAPAAGADGTTTAAIDKSTLNEVPVDQIKSEEFVGTTVYGANDENIGEIGDVVMTDDKVDAVIIDVGGFLGIGEKQVAVGMDNLAFMADDQGKRYLYTEFTKEQLEAAAEYDESAWAEKRDDMRLVVPN